MWDCIGYQGECTTSTQVPPSPLHPLTCSSDKMDKELKKRLLKAKGNPSFLEGVQDINVVCGVLKDFLRCLREPFLTFKMHNAFLQASGMEREITEPTAFIHSFISVQTESEAEENGLASTLEAIAELPPANKDTLAFIIQQKYTPPVVCKDVHSYILVCLQGCITQ